MKFQLVVLGIFFFSDVYLVKTHDVPELTDTTPEAFPFHAVIHGRMVCGGILITNNYVIAPGYCVHGESTVTVYLGFRGYPYYKSHHSEPNTQIYHCTDIIIHEDFAKIKDHHYLNNIALIKLPHSVTINNVVRPGKLISRHEAQFLEGRFAKISGWLVSKDENIKFSTVQLRNQDTCSFLFGHDFLTSQEFCVNWFTKTRLNLLGNAVAVDDKIIGFQTNTPYCNVASSSCTRNDIVLVFVPFLDWMSHVMDVPIKQFTAKIHSPECCDNKNILTKIAHLSNKIDDIITSDKTKYEKYELRVTNLNEKVENLVVQVQTIKNEQNNFAISLNEQIGALKTEINNSRIRDKQDMLRLQEEINGARTEVSNGLSAQKSLTNLESKFESLNNTVQNEVDEKINKLEIEFKYLLNKTENNHIAENEHYLEHKHEITKLYEKLHEIDVRELKHLHDLKDQFGYFNTTIVGISTAQNIFHQQIEDIKIHISKENDFNQLHDDLREVIDTVHKNAHHAHVRFNEIENLFGEQRNDMDKHIIQEHTQIQSLWSEIKSLNTSIHKIMDFMYEGPGST